MIPPFLIRPLIYASVAGVALGAAYLKGRSDGSEKYFSLVAELSASARQVARATEKANTTRKAEKSREAEIFAGLDLRLSNELPKITAAPNCAIPDSDRVRILDDLARTANAAIRMRGEREGPAPEKPAP